ncbi:MAG: hypothetical protein ACREID_00645 [Planctomycetota bacterium]
MRAVAALLAVAASAAWARPPEVPGFMNMNDLAQKYEARVKELKEKAEFEAKSREEKMVICFERGDEKFENKALTGERVVEELLKRWTALSDFGEEDERLVQLLPVALKTRMGVGVATSSAAKTARYRASEPLVEALKDKHFPVRRAAILALEGIYSTQLLYNPDGTTKQLREWHGDWKDHILKMRK